MAKFFSPEVYFYKKNKKIRETFLISQSVSHSLPRLRRGGQEGGVGVREANYVRVSKLRQVYKLRQECKLRQACKLRRATAVVRGQITASYGRR